MRLFSYLLKIGRKHKAHRQQLSQSKPWRDSEKGRSKGKGKGKHTKMGQDQSQFEEDDGSPIKTLESLSVEAVAKFINDGKAQRIVVMTGAGISTSAGIPDFRSPETGLYANLARLKLPYAEAVFDISYFRNNPLPFYTLAQELYPGKYRPTITHSFIHLLHRKGLLLKLFTQNIDCLEREAGVPDEKIVEAHGSFARQSCIECKSPYPQDLMMKAIQDKTVPHCLSESCNGLVKPEIVFFGEQLPRTFFENTHLLSKADLCIVLGTSLSVHPFAGLPQLCTRGTPRVLINQEEVGDMGSRPNDVLVLGDCDAGVRKLAEACGWLEELESIWARTAPSKQPKTEKERAKKSRDEKLQEEIEQLTKGIDESLRIGAEQQKWLAEHVDNNIERKQDNKEAESRNPAPEKAIDSSSYVIPPSFNPAETEQDFPSIDKRQNQWMETHLRNKSLRIQEDDAQTTEPTPLSREQEKENSSSTGPLSEPVAQTTGGGGLAHVYPHMDKKASL